MWIILCSLQTYHNLHTRFSVTRLMLHYTIEEESIYCIYIKSDELCA